MKHILFVGLYPNEIEKYLNVFFQNLIFAMCDLGIRCTVISPVSVTRYKKAISQIPYETIQKTPGGNEVTVYYPRTVSFSSKNICGFHFYRLTEKAFSESALRCSRQIKDVDAVYGHFLLRGGLAALKIAKAKKIPGYFAYGECSYDTEIEIPYGKVSSKQLENLTGAIAVSTKNKNDLINILGLPEEKILLAPNAIDTGLFHPIDREIAEQKIRIEKTKDFTVGFVGGFIERKGDKRVLEAINDIDGVVGMFAGRGDNPPEGKKVKFCKALPHEVLPDFYNCIDVFVLPTLAEGCSNAIIEALACGKPVISSELDFNFDVLNENNSIMVDPNSIIEIKEAIRLLKNDRKLYERLSDGAINTAKELSIKRRAEKVKTFMEQSNNV